LRVQTLLALAVWATTNPAFAQEPEPYSPPRTAAGHPDFSGTWKVGFLTLMERPPGVMTLVVSPDEQKKVAGAILSRFPDVVDPDFPFHGISDLALVKGEYRTSMIVDPPDGKLPYTPTGLALAQATMERTRTKFDNPEDRPLSERCLGGLGVAPMRGFILDIPRRIVQTPEHVVIYSEDPGGVRIVPLDGDPPPDGVRSTEGYSVGRWENDTLVIDTANLSVTSARFGVGRPVMVSPKTVVEDRLERVSDNELSVRFTVHDPDLYTRPWSGEFSFYPLDADVYEYGCQERNYSLPHTLRGG
jgi:hypothetical protein